MRRKLRTKNWQEETEAPAMRGIGSLNCFGKKALKRAPNRRRRRAAPMKFQSTFRRSCGLPELTRSKSESLKKERGKPARAFSRRTCNSCQPFSLYLQTDGTTGGRKL